MHPSKSHSEYIDEFYKLVGDLAAIYTAISDEDHAFLLLTSLPSSYDNFVETLLYGRDTLKLEDVLTTLNSRELQKMTGKKQHTQVSGSRADGRDYLVDFEEYDGDNILLGDGRECRVRGTGKVQVQIRDGSSFVLDNVKYVLELIRNLISLCTLEKEGFTLKMQSGKIKVIKGSLMALSGTIKANCVYTLDGHAVTRKTLKGRKQLGEYQTRWKIKTVWSVQGSLGRGYNHVYISSEQGTGSVQVLQGVEFEVEPQEDHTFEVEPHGNVDHVAGSQEVQTQDLIYYHLARNREQHSIHELFSHREDSNEAAFAVAEAKKIYAHESLTFNNTVACEVISKWKAGLKDDIDAQSYVYVLSNSYKKCSDDGDAEIWATKGLLDKAKENVFGMEIIRDQSGNTLRGSLSGDCDVEKNDVGMLDKFDRGLQTDVQVFVDFDYAMERSITIMGRSITRFPINTSLYISQHENKKLERETKIRERDERVEREKR
ncbi:hypothetical protein Tco_0481205 [Tanacetum coccineum]